MESGRGKVPNGELSATIALTRGGGVLMFTYGRPFENFDNLNFPVLPLK